MLYPLIIRRCKVAAIAALFTLPARAITLPEAERLALARNFDVALGASAVASASGAIIAAGQRPNPTLSFQTVNIDRQRGIGAGPLRDKAVDSTLGLSWLVERGDKRELRVGVAKGMHEAAQMDFAEVRRQLRLAVHTAFFDLKFAEARARLLSESRALAEQSLVAANRRVEAGDLAPLERSRLQVEVVRLQNDSRAAEGEWASARQGLALLLGGSMPAESLAADDEWPSPSVRIEEGPGADVTHRPDLRAAIAREEAARVGVRLAKSQAVRDVTVGSSVERFPPDMRASYGLSVSIPLFASHAYEGEMAKALADAEASRLQREKAVVGAATEAARLRAQLSAARDRLERLLGGGMASAEEAARGAEFAYAKGAISLTDLLDARRQHRSVKLDLAQAQADHAKALAAWRAATEWEQQP